MLPRNMLNWGRALVAATPSAGFAAGTTARTGDVITAFKSGRKGRFLGFLLIPESVPSTVSALTIQVYGHTLEAATAGQAGWTAMTAHDGTTLRFEGVTADAGLLDDLKGGTAVFGSVDLERSPFLSHRLSMVALTGTTAWLTAAYVVSHKRRVEANGDQTDYLIDDQHLADA